MTHAILSPSSAHRWLTCSASVKDERGLPDLGSRYADEGTAAHFLAAHCLNTGLAAKEFGFRSIVVSDDGQTCFEDDQEARLRQDGGVEFVITEDMVRHVQSYVDYVNEIKGEGSVAVECPVPLEFMTGEKGAQGTVDAVIIHYTIWGTRLTVVDFKYGRGVKVEAQDNPQLLMYAAAAAQEFGIAFTFNTVGVAIHQPRMDNVSEQSLSMNALSDFVAMVIEKASQITVGDTSYNPTKKGCLFCKAKATCPALTQALMNSVAGDFVDLTKPLAPQLAEGATLKNPTNDKLSAYLGVVDTIESWCKAVRARAEAELLSGGAIKGYKLVQGKRGPRKWCDASAVEATMKAMRLTIPQMYDLSLISPTSAEKLVVKGVLGEKQWQKLKGMYEQTEGKPSVAPRDDPRPHLKRGNPADDFEDARFGPLENPLENPSESPLESPLESA